ncbi:hypothetical protein [Bradyrhizobium sp. USDA 4469]
MKNSELLTTKRWDLEPTEKQQQFVLRSLVQKNACPNCGHMLNFFEGAGIGIDDWEDKPGPTACRCVSCERALDYVVPALGAGGSGGWHWRLVPITLRGNQPES